MQCKIIDDQDCDDITISLNLLAVKAFQNITMKHLNDFELRIQKGQEKTFSHKIIPFYLKNFFDYVEQDNNKIDIEQLKQLLNQIKSNQSVQVLISIFQKQQHKSLQYKWIDYMEGRALIDVLLYIKSKKVRIIYLEKLQILKEEISNNQPYLNMFNKENQEEIMENNKPDHKIKSEYKLLKEIMPKRKMIILGSLRK